MNKPTTITALRPEHRDAVLAIYSDGIATGQATFETDTPTWEQWDATHLPFGRLAALEEDEVLGWAALSPVSDRCAYGGVAEISVYVASDQRGKGIGPQLLARLIEESEEHGVWTLQAGIFPENPASITMHQKLGFREVGRRERLGKLAGEWRDVLLLERRSEVVGVEESDNEVRQHG